MKLVSLNTWGCRITEPLFDFIRNNSESVDIFCFQEILKDGSGVSTRGEIKSGYEDISRLLPEHTGYFSEYGEGGYYGESSKALDFKFGIACFVRSNIKQSFGNGITLIDPARNWSDYSGRFAVGTALSVQAGDYAVINVHGLWQGSIKGDTEAKMEQSKKIIDLADKTEGKKIICGDFNLLPDTKSIKMLDDKYENLIRKYEIKDTRGSLYTKDLRYSDYAFTDTNIIVHNFTVPNMSVSDHLPLVIHLS